jgi:D-hexose-6-phosphate mutarotase
VLVALHGAQASGGRLMIASVCISAPSPNFTSTHSGGGPAVLSQFNNVLVASRWPKHGFARTQPWQSVSRAWTRMPREGTCESLVLNDNADTLCTKTHKDDNFSLSR